MANKLKLLCILHYSPPVHGASKVGDFIKESKVLNENFECKFIKIKSSYTIGDIGKVNIKKFYYVAELYFKVLWALVVFRPDKIYFTASIRSVAFYRDLLLSILWKSYRIFKKIPVFYHYHTKGVDEFVSASNKNLILTKFFIKDIDLVLLSPLLEKDFEKVKTYNKVFFLPNGVEDSFKQQNFDQFIQAKYKKIEQIELLYLSNMIKEKGYFEVLKLAKEIKNENVYFHFAGGWQNDQDEKDFFDFIKKNKLEKKVTFHGFVNGNQKRELFENAHLFIFPTRYPKEAFPLSLLESLAYGVPVISTDEGSIPYIIDTKSGILIHDKEELPNALKEAVKSLTGIENAIYCRERYLQYFSLVRFEQNLLSIINE